MTEEIEKKKFWGKYLGILRDRHDPEMLGRIRAEVPEIYGTGREHWSPWALPCFPPGSTEVLSEGVAVWIEFRNGDPAKPIWTGWMPQGSGGSSTIPIKRICPSENPFPCADCPEPPGKEHTVNREDYYDHLPFHDHEAEPGQFFCPRIGYVLNRTESGHRIYYDDKHTREKLIIEDQAGQKVSMVCPSGQWDPTYIEIEDKNGQTILMYCPPPASFDPSYIRIKDKAGQTILMKGGFEAMIEMKDKLGQTVKLNALTGMIEIDPLLLCMIKGDLVVTGTVFDVVGNLTKDARSGK